MKVRQLLCQFVKGGGGEINKRRITTIVMSWTGDPTAQPYTLTQGKSLAMTAIDVLSKPELLQKIKEDFATDIRART